MEDYKKLLGRILDYGSEKVPAREGLPSTKSLFDNQIAVYNKSLPILMGKKVLFQNVLSELIWFLKGSTNIRFLHEYNNHIWDDDAYRFYCELGGVLTFEEWLLNVDNFNDFAINNKLEGGTINERYRYGDCGRIYGYQWRRCGESNLQKNSYFNNTLEERKPVDQIKNLIESLKNTPDSRYHIVDAWSPQDRQDKLQALPSCHVFFQCYVDEYKKLSISVWQRSCDMFLGVPYNLLSYGILQRILCKFTGYEIGNFIWHGGDCHIYDNQRDAVKEYLSRELPENKAQLLIRSDHWKSIEDINVGDFALVDYNPLPFIKAPLSTGAKK